MTAPIERQVGFRARALDERSSEARLAAIGQQLSGVLHDLTSPLTVASGYVQLMAAEGSEERRQAYLGRVLRQFEEIASMSRELLAFAGGERQPSVAPVPLSLLALDWQEMLTLELAGHRVGVRVEAEGTARPMVDVGRLRRIVSNLGRNAAEAVAPGGRVELRISAGDTEFCITCEDDGPGIPEALRESIFERGFSTRSGDGRGFGLAIVNECVGALGGRVLVSASALGGARFEVRIPLAPSDA